MITIWGNADSVNVQKILWCCEELALPYRRIDAGRHFGAVNTEAFRKLNPNRLVPTIDDAGFVLWESNAILRYLAARYSEGVLWPTDALERAKSDRWMDWSLTTLWPSLVPLFRAFMRTPEANRDQNAIEIQRLEATATLAILDAALAASPYIAGSTLTIGDLALGPAVWRWFALPIERTNFPHLKGWFDRLSSRAPYRDIVRLPLT